MIFFLVFCFHTLATAGVIWGVEHYLLPEYFSVTGDNLISYIFVALVFGLFNAIIKPILKILMIPMQFITLGLAGIGINGVLLWTVVQTVQFLDINHTQVHVSGILMYLVVGLLLGVAHTIIHLGK